MSMINSTVEIKNGKVVFSEEVLEYFENLRNEENSEWINKYFKVLSDESNLSAEKYNLHHIRPCFTFKDNEHRKRRETKPLGDKFNGNLIKLSIYNHLFAHYYLWKIFGNKDSKTAFQRMCGEGKYIDNLTEDEIRKIAKLKEECAKKNIGKTASKKKYSDNNKEKIKKSREKYKINNKEKIEEYNKNYNKSDKRKKVSKNYYERHKNEESYIKSQEKYYNSEKAKQRREELNKRRYFDPKTENYYSHRNIVWRLKEFPQMYKNMTINDFRCISIEDDEYKNWKKTKRRNIVKK